MLIKPLKAAKKNKARNSKGRRKNPSAKRRETRYQLDVRKLTQRVLSVRWKQPMIMPVKHATNEKCGKIGNFL